jgi:hypothetical protein
VLLAKKKLLPPGSSLSPPDFGGDGGGGGGANNWRRRRWRNILEATTSVYFPHPITLGVTSEATQMNRIGLSSDAT